MKSNDGEIWRPQGRAGCPQPVGWRDEDIAPYLSCKPFAALLFALLSMSLTSAAAETTLATLFCQDTPRLCAAPVSTEIDLAKLTPRKISPDRLRLVETTGNARIGTPVAAQFEFNADSPSRGRLWWVLTPSQAGERRFVLKLASEQTPARLTITDDPRKQCYDIAEAAQPVLRYNHGTVLPPPGIDAHYARGNYIMPLFGPAGEVLTDDFPKDHPHHRGVSWSWPVTRWKDEVRDIWAVQGVWARPVKIHRADGGPVFATLEAENVWKWGDTDPIVREEVVIRAFPASGDGRVVDIEVRLTALADGVAIGGRPDRGYGGFGLRAANATERVITRHIDPPGSNPRCSWLDYSGAFAGGSGVSGMAMLEHATNPGYPNELQEYGHCNYVMPAFPGRQEVSLSKTTPLILKHRLWVHAGNADERKLADISAAYQNPPRITISRK